MIDWRNFPSNSFILVIVWKRRHTSSNVHFCELCTTWEDMENQDYECMMYAIYIYVFLFSLNKKQKWKTTLNLQQFGAGIAELVACRIERCNTDTCLSPQCSKGFFWVSFLRRFIQCLYSPPVQLNASTSVHALKILNTGSHTIVWTLGNTAHTDRNG